MKTGILFLLMLVCHALAHSTMVCLDVVKDKASDPTPPNRCRFHSRKFDAYNHFQDGAGGDESFAWVTTDGQPSWSGEYSGNTRNGCFLKGQGDSTPGQNGCVDWTNNYNCAGCKLGELKQGDSFSPMHYARTHANSDAMVYLRLFKIVEGKPEYSDPNIDSMPYFCSYMFRENCDGTGQNQATSPCWPKTPCQIPTNQEPGNYTLVWRWIWSQTGPNRADYSSAADLKIYASDQTIPTQNPTSTPTPQPTQSDDGTPVKVFVTVTVEKPADVVSLQDFIAEVTGFLSLPKAAIDDISIDLDQSSATTTFVKFTFVNALKSDGTRVDPIAAARTLRDLINNRDASLKSTFYLSGMKINDVVEPDEANGGISNNTTIIIIVCVVGGVFFATAIAVALIVTRARRAGRKFF